ncbi:hypothetical protein SDC9_200393 [bioreactor metagenome]|uniref:Uncharacterized protein n=1 Tax=bioreactor metagenome TaxID=1076179 RepID=A0A645IN47_9ZZZZ
MFKAEDFIFEPVDEAQVMAEYTADCSNAGRSCCCTRSCTQNGLYASEEEWGQFLELNAGVVQY